MVDPGSYSAYCACRGRFDHCLKEVGCPASVVTSHVKACVAAGCNATQCAASSLQHNQSPVVGLDEEPLTLTLGAAGCDQPHLSACASSLTTCIMGNPGSATAVCNCRGGYDSCVKDAGCQPQIVASVVKACEAAGCSASVCSA